MPRDLSEAALPGGLVTQREAVLRLAAGVERALGLPGGTVLARDARRVPAMARAAVAAVALADFGLPVRTVARVLGVNHATVIHARKRVAAADSAPAGDDLGEVVAVARNLGGDILRSARLAQAVGPEADLVRAQLLIERARGQINVAVVLIGDALARLRDAG